ncbi:MAG: hypothetical protein FJX72_20450, partial [Armatimonadetes bacterium]|nr:hypothetical protein [Armatimonadota bacterium]
MLCALLQLASTRATAAQRSGCGVNWASCARSGTASWQGKIGWLPKASDFRLSSTSKSGNWASRLRRSGRSGRTTTGAYIGACARSTEATGSVCWGSGARRCARMLPSWSDWGVGSTWLRRLWRSRPCPTMVARTGGTVRARRPSVTVHRRQCTCRDGVSARHTARQPSVLRSPAMASPSFVFQLPYFYRTHDLDEALGVPEFEKVVKPLIWKAADVADKAVRKARIGDSDLAGVLLAGGSSQIPLVCDLLRERFSCRVRVVGHDLMWLIAKGAAVHHRDLMTRPRQAMRMILGLDLYLEMLADGRLTPI